MTNGGGLGLVPIDDNSSESGPPKVPPSGMAALKQRRQELFDAREREFVVPGYENLTFNEGVLGDLVARYQRLDVEEFRRALYGPADTEVQRNGQFLIDSLTGLFWRVDAEDGDGTTLIPFAEGEASGWHDLAAALELDLGPDADAVTMLVEGVFGGNEVAMTDHAGDVGRWMQQGQRAADQEFLGGR